MNRMQRMTQRGRTLLIEVVQYFSDQSDICEFLLESNADPNISSPDLITPLACAAAIRDLEAGASSAIADAKANLEAEDMLNRTALMISARHGHEDFPEMMLDSGSKTTARDYLGRSALHHACTSERYEDAPPLQTLRRLWSSQGVFLRDKCGRCALWYALHNPTLNDEWLVAVLEQALAEVEAESWPVVADRLVVEI